MMNASQYGNAFALFDNGTNFQSLFLLGADTEDGNLGWNRATYYSNIRDSAFSPPGALTPTQRLTGGGFGGNAFPGWHGPRPVAFPLTDSWNFDHPIVT